LSRGPKQRSGVCEERSFLGHARWGDQDETPDDFRVSHSQSDGYVAPKGMRNEMSWRGIHRAKPGGQPLRGLRENESGIVSSHCSESGKIDQVDREVFGEIGYVAPPPSGRSREPVYQHDRFTSSGNLVHHDPIVDRDLMSYWNVSVSSAVHDSCASFATRMRE
jgi:hypothetical protein